VKHRTPLVLVEQTLMLLIFAVAAAICLQAFVWSNQSSKAGQRETVAMEHAQNMAQTLKYCRGDFEAAAAQYGGSWDGERWTYQADDVTLTAQREASAPLVGKAAVFWDGELLLTAAWQEVAADGS